MSRVTPVLDYSKVATIANAATISAEVDLDGATLCGLFLPSTFSGSTITFEHSSAAGGSFSEIIDSTGSAISAVVAQGKYLAIDPSLFAGIRFLKIVSDVSEAAQRDVVLAIRGL